MTALSTSLAMITLLNSIPVEQRINKAIQECVRKQYWKKWIQSWGGSRSLAGNGLVAITMRFPTSNQSALWWHP